MKTITTRVDRLTAEGFGYTSHNGNDVFIIGAIPGETVVARIIKKRKGRRWAIVEKVLEADAARIGEFEGAAGGIEDHYLSCSPWQVFAYEKQVALKQEMLRQAYEDQDIYLDVNEFISAEQTDGYRTKMECNFWYHENYLHIAFHKRGTPFVLTPLPHGCKLASPAMNTTALRIVELINTHAIPKSDLKSLTIRESKTQNQRVAILCVKREDFSLPFGLDEVNSALEKAHSALEKGNSASKEGHLSGLVTVFSDPLSPASLFTKILKTEAQDYLEETIAGLQFRYPLDGFFQNNVPLFENALVKMRDVVKSQNQPRKIVELYSGVGTIGLALCQQADHVFGIESVPSSITFAQENARRNNIKNYQCQAVPAEKMESSLLADTDILVLDPPRIGLHQDVVNYILEAQPQTILYLSCNPVTQARDYKLLQQHYSPTSLTGFDFYPNTMHMESLLVLEKRE